MPPTELTILLPCHSLEDFPLELTGADAEGLLAAWSAMWHPRLVAATGKTLRWYRADYPPDDLAGRIVVIPPVSERVLLTGWLDRAVAEGATVIRNETARDTIVARALAVLDDQPPAADDPELVADFLALGFGYLGLELLTRQMRYISNLDEAHFESQVLAAARAAVDGQFDAARDHLSSTFDVLMEGRERFYPVDSYLLDLTLVAPTTFGPALVCELTQDVPVNLVACAATIEQMAATEPATLAALRSALERGSAALIGGGYDESPLPLITAEEIRASLVRGAAVYDRHLGCHPKVFGRRSAGLVASLPQILGRSGYLGAIHATLDEGRIPHVGQSKARWQGWDHSSLDAVARTPLDAREPGTFLGLAAKLGETMDLDHVAALALAHWPGGASPWYDDLRRIHRFVPLFGKFVTVDEFFSQTDTAGRFAKLTADDYQTPYLTQSVRTGATDSISRYVHNAQAAVDRLARSGLSSMQTALNPRRLPDVASAEQGAIQPAQPLDDSLTQALAASITQGGEPAAVGTLVVNPFSFPRTEVVELPTAGGGRVRQSVEVPALGFAWLDSPTNSPPLSKKKQPKNLAGELTLANEYFEISVHPETGGIGALHDYRTRGNRLSQQLALRSGRAGDAGEYSSMRAESIEVMIADPAEGAITSRGNLVVGDERVVARFEQTVRAVRGSRVAELQIRLEIDELPAGDPWACYYGSRFAWSNDEADLHRSITGTSQPTEAKRLEAPHFLEIRDERHRTALLTGGLPFHRRSGPRMLDTLLVVPGEVEREFRLGIGVDLPCAEMAALALMRPRLPAVVGVPCPRGHRSGWLYRLDCGHAVATHWEPIVAADDPGRATGFRVRILETEGKPGRARLYSCRPIRAARQVDLLGQPLVELRLADDGIVVDLGAFEWLEVEAEWRDG